MTVTQEGLIMNTFYVTYVFLITTGTIILSELLRTKEEKVRNILNLETCISVIDASFFYGKFVKDFDAGIDNKKINETHYVDWAITTPIMLLILVLAFLPFLQFLQIFSYIGSQLCHVGIRLCGRNRIDGQNHLQRARIHCFRRNILLLFPKLHQGAFQQR